MESSPLPEYFSNVVRTVADERKGRGRAYGGKSGVWLKLRSKTRVLTQDETPPNTDVTPDESSLDSANDEKKEDISAKDENGAGDKQSESPSLRRLVGWDDDLCRPIYYNNNNTKHNNFSSESDNGSDGSDSDEIDYSKEELIDNSEDETRFLSRESGRKRSYGSNKSSSLLTHQGPSYWDVTTSSPSYFNVNNGNKMASPPLPKPTVESTAKAATVRVTPSTATKIDNNVSAADTEKISKRARKKKVEDTATSVTIHTQLSSHTSESVAKAFFDRLDANSLSVETTNENSTTKHDNDRCIRTQRVPNVRSQALIEEYRLYERSVTENNTTTADGKLRVVPLSIAEYANQRGVHFVTERGIDGVLDST